VLGVFGGLGLMMYFTIVPKHRHKKKKAK